MIPHFAARGVIRRSIARPFRAGSRSSLDYRSSRPGTNRSNPLRAPLGLSPISLAFSIPGAPLLNWSGQKTFDDSQVSLAGSIDSSNLPSISERTWIFTRKCRGDRSRPGGQFSKAVAHRVFLDASIAPKSGRLSESGLGLGCLISCSLSQSKLASGTSRRRKLLMRFSRLWHIRRAPAITTSSQASGLYDHFCEIL